MSINKDKIFEQLDEIIDPCSAANGTHLSVVDMGLIEGIDIQNQKVVIKMLLTSPMCTQIPYFIEEVRNNIGTLEEVDNVRLKTDQGFQWHEGLMNDKARERRKEYIEFVQNGEGDLPSVE